MDASRVMGVAMLGVLIVGGAVLAQEQGDEEPAIETEYGDRMIAAYFAVQTAEVAGASLKDVKTLEQWEAGLEQRRRRLREMLGLEPMPERTDLRPVVTGVVEHEGFRVEKLYFESMPRLYVTANLYVPEGLEEPAPAVLYVCGHAQVKEDGVSYGNKVAYHHHGAWFARNGYICLTIDSLQRGEIEGMHHGTYRYGKWWWNSRGYTPAGLEAWNCVRALDYLQRRPEVDGARLGVTGRSGGGIYSWWIAALDERIRAAVPVAGITDLHNHVVDGGPGPYADGTVEGHCDCMFMLNTYRWDFAEVAALAAPRPLLISNSDKDPIFPLDGVIRLHEKVRRVYRLYGAEQKLGLHVTEGPHEDTQELRVGAFGWFNRFLKEKRPLIEDAAEQVFDKEQLRVFHRPPEDQINTRVSEVFVPKAASPAAAEAVARWSELRGGWMAALRREVFGSWPEEALVSTPVVRELFAAEHRGVRFAGYEFTSQREVHLPLYVLHRAGLDEPGGDGVAASDETMGAVVLTVIDQEAWERGLAAMRTAFPKELEGLSPAGTDTDAELFERIRAMVAGSDAVFAYVPPRGVGPTVWNRSERKQTHHRRRFMLLGQTLDGMRVWDVRRAVAALGAIEGLGDRPVELAGEGVSAGLALYAGLFEPRVSRLDLRDLPASHTEGPILLNVLRHMDVPQAVAMAAEHRPVALRGGAGETWAWVREVAERLGWDESRRAGIRIEP